MLVAMWNFWTYIRSTLEVTSLVNYFWFCRNFNDLGVLLLWFWITVLNLDHLWSILLHCWLSSICNGRSFLCDVACLLLALLKSLRYDETLWGHLIGCWSLSLQSLNPLLWTNLRLSGRLRQSLVHRLLLNLCTYGLWHVSGCKF